MDNKQQMILARDIIDMIRKYKDDAAILEYLEGITFSLANIFENKSSIINWYDIASVCDQRYYSLQQGDPIDLDTKILDRNYKIAIKEIKKTD